MYKIKHSQAHSPALQRFLAKCPQHVADSFTEEQLLFLAQTLDTKRWKTHPVDWRCTVRLWRYRYYLVILAGRNRRHLSRIQHKIGKLGLALGVMTILTLCVMTGLVFLYFLKSALGIDLFASISLGLWH